MTVVDVATSPGVEITDLVKRYGDTWALAGLSVSARPGEILGVAGPNGAGKSTLVKVLAGETMSDSGLIEIDGIPWNQRHDGSRVAVVHQEPQLFPNLTVAENLLVGVERSKVGWPRSGPTEKEVLREVGLLPQADHLVGQLPLALQQRTEIARALVKRADVFLFDEPNSALTEDESSELFERMHGLADSGKVVMLVSHRLGELAAHCDRIVVIVDGKVRTELADDEISEERIARELVVGRSNVAPVDERVTSDETLLGLSGWSHRRSRFVDVDLELRVGEILAIVGVEGSGGRELVRSVAGFEPSTGQMSLGEKRGAMAQREVAYVTGDRSASLFDNLSVGENLFFRQSGDLTSRTGLLRRGEARRQAQASREAFFVKTQALETPIRALSGGNQQKVAIAAALALRPELVALEEPTRGVDLGSKTEIYRLLQEYCRSGAGVLLYCTEDSEVYDAADRVAVMARGRLAGVLDVRSYPDAEQLAEATAALAGSDLPHHQSDTEERTSA